ncbi:hypothetical protein FBZ93_108309 [Bradyrhizobium macuxiense]|uniref:Uncharacterized protein n=1 Tax=Bradyrhizobium macuxiense TaxID=1755647 RepID=A0A560LLH4_9BRAD|nr:hypothetical protein [Bradyrhizobium macuxiense]TWB96267.1 hypothetical protein FBZ93_108309 [Bradyrhizobium macuxiense]
MKVIMLAIAVAGLTAMQAEAQTQQHTPLPEIVVGTPPPALNLNRDTNGGAGRAATRGGSGAPAERCGDAASLGCINERLKKQVDQVNPPVTNTPPIDAKSSDLKVGVVNVPAVQQQYGRNFGVSAFPYRPAAPVYSHR